MKDEGFSHFLILKAKNEGWRVFPLGISLEWLQINDENSFHGQLFCWRTVVEVVGTNSRWWL